MKGIRYAAVLWTGLLLAGGVASQPPVKAASDVTVWTCDARHLQSAMASAGATGTVHFACSGTITLAAQIAVSTNLTLDGSGQSVTISGGNHVGVFFVHSWASLTLNHLTIANGLASNGAGIDSIGTLTVTNSTLSGNGALGAGGGAIDNGGSLNVANSTFSGNYASMATGGSGRGGGILNSGKASVTSSTFSGDSADASGGGIYNTGTLSVAMSTFSGNVVARSSGGAIFSSGALNVTTSTFSGNGAAADFGGGGGISAGSMSVTDSTFSGNSAATGGAIAGGGNITNSTFSGNSAEDGGGIAFSGDITNSTFSGNSGGAVRGTITLANTILAGSRSGGNCAGGVADGGGNVDDGTTCGFGPASLSNTNPQLQPLANNGGPTQTMALIRSASPAIGRGLAAICRSTAPTSPVNDLDQRGLSRHADIRGRCDSGAYDTGS